MNALHISRNNIKMLFAKYGIKISRGQRARTMSIEQIMCAKEYLSKYKICYQRLSQVLMREEDNLVHMGEWDARKVYELKNLYVSLKEYSIPSNEYNLRFVANYVNYAWQTDLHQLEMLEEETNKARFALLC